MSPAYAGARLRRRSSIRLGIFRNRSLGTALDQLTQNPLTDAVKHLKPGSTKISMRVGNYRILFDRKRLSLDHALDRLKVAYLWFG